MTDFSPQIRAEIERAVRYLKAEIEEPYSWIMTDRPRHPIRAQYVGIGYLTNTHRGLALYQSGDLLCDLPVRVDYINVRTLRVAADDIEFVNEEGDYVTDVEAEVTW